MATRQSPTRSVPRANGVRTLSDVVALTEDRSAAHEVVLELGGAAWPAFHYTATDRAVRHLATKGAAMVVLGGADTGWLVRSLHACLEASRLPVAVLTPHPAEHARLLLDEGATVVLDVRDDPDDVVAKLRALGQGTATARGLDVRWLEAEGLRLDLSGRRCEVDGRRVGLSMNEFDLLKYLMSQPQQVVAAGRITADLWNLPDASGLNTLRLNVRRLRKKLGEDPHHPLWIESVRGVGYQFMRAVVEVGQERSEERLRHTVASLNAQHDGLYDLIEELRTVRDTTELATAVVGWATDRNFADASTVFRFEQRDGARYSSLVAAAGMSTRWRQTISRGHRVDDGFIASAAYLRGEVVQLSDMSRPNGRFSVTQSMSSAENLHACLIFPVFHHGAIWGDVGFMSKETRAFPPARARYLRAVGDLVSLTLAAVSPPEEVPDAVDR
jgi:DNA-binding response OmpR family regulator